MERALAALGIVALVAVPARAGESVVLLELFTSQGCSSCPAAESVLSRLGLVDPLQASVVPLEYHVDYWNEGGWKDPFGTREWTLRQAAYGQALKLEAPYTPQLVIAGHVEFPGGNEARVRAAVAAELAAVSGATLALEARRPEPGRVAVNVSAELAGALASRKLEVKIALYENGLVTPIGRGENAGRTLRNDFIVRRLATAFSLEPKAGARKQRQLTLKLDSEWNARNLGVAAFLQDPASMRIFGATAVRSIE